MSAKKKIASFLGLAFALLHSHDGGAAEPQRFAFESSRDSVAQALSTLLHGYRAPRRSATEHATIRKAETQARAYLATNRSAAIGTLKTASSTLPAGAFNRRRELIYLYESVGSDLAVSPLVGIASQRRVADEAVDSLRFAAVSALQAVALSGSLQAKAALMQLVSASDPAIRKAAVRGVYAYSPNRRQARRAMQKRLPRSEFYVLNQ